MKSSVENQILICLILALAVSNPVAARQSTEDSVVDFLEKVQPIFAEHCIHCHGPDIHESNFRLDVRDIALGPGDIGQPPIVAGNSSQSAILNYVSGNDPAMQMPPDGEGDPLTSEQIEILRQWIDQGARWPDELAGDASVLTATDWWSLQPLQFRKVSPTKDQPNEIDIFIASKLKENSLDLSPPADRRTLLRRLYLDLHGLPPSVDQVNAFLADENEDAWTTVVDAALASQRYGEAWARHWLDVVRFGESTGFEVNRDRANAYFYRDYVIDSLNEDKSYRDFVIEQIAGDALGVDAATGFLVGGPYDTVKSPDINLTLMQRQDELADIVNTTGMTFLALTVGCARCHNHKFDPITQTDYFSLQAIFSGVRHGERRMLGLLPADQKDNLEAVRNKIKQLESRITALRNAAGPLKVNENLKPPVNARLNEDNFSPVLAKQIRFTVRDTNSGGEPCIDELEVFEADSENNVALSSEGAIATSSGNFSGNPKHKLKHINDGKYGNDHSWISNTAGSGWVQIDFDKPVSIDRIRWARDREENFADRLATSYEFAVSADDTSWTVVVSSDERQPYLNDGQEPPDGFVARLPEVQQVEARALLDQLNKSVQARDELEQSIPLGYVGTFAEPEPVHRLFRGDPMAPRELVNPGAIDSVGALELDTATVEQERRIALAHWIASDENPLTARVIVNRVWHYHFGHGIVATPSDFGKNGALPSHPELLDFLASEFMRNGWSLKWLHRKILTSRTYQQSSLPNANALAIDADSCLLWRYPPRRLTAEAIRDCVLAVTGKLNHAGGGPGFLLFEIDRENVHHYFPLEQFEPEHFRRMVYMTKIRQEQDEVFGAFDCPDGGQAIPSRSRSTTPLQALNLLNSKFMLGQSEFFAARLQEAHSDPPSQIRLAFQLVYSRRPNDEELDDSKTFVGQYGLSAFCRALLNSNEFLFMN